jgi:chromosome segregation ATPase
MAKSIEELQKEFDIQKTPIVRELNNNEQKIRRELNKLVGKVSALKQQQKNVQALGSKAKKNIELAQHKMSKNKREIIEDAGRIRFLKKRIKQLKREIPVLERNIKKITPERNKLALRDRKLARLQIPLNKQISKSKEIINNLRAQIKKLNRKENFIKKGRIVWGEFRRLRRKILAKKRTIGEQKPKNSFFNKLFKR